MWKKQQLVMLPTDKAESGSLIVNTVANTMWKQLKGNSYFTQDYLSSIPAKSYHLYLLSDDEIKENDWCVFMGINNNTYIFKASIIDIDLEDEVVHTGTCYHKLKDCKKIIATTDGNLGFQESIYDPRSGTGGKWIKLSQIPESFINKFITEYNNDNVITEVEVEFYHTHETGYDKELCIKINSDNTINIKEIVEKPYTKTKKELAKLLTTYAAYLINDSDNKKLLSVDEWIDKHV